LPADNLVAREVRDISDTRLAARLEDHPADMGPDQAVVGTIGVKVGVCVTMVRTVTTRPPLDRALYGACASHGQKVFERL